MIFTTVSICGAYFFIVVSTPALSVIWFTLQLIHAPSRRTLTCLSSSIEISVMSPPSEFKKGLISSRANNTLLVNSSVVIIFNVSIKQCGNETMCQLDNFKIILNHYLIVALSKLSNFYFFTAEQPAIVVILMASVAGKLSFLFTVSCTTFRVISSKMVSIIEAVCKAAGRP